MARTLKISRKGDERGKQRQEHLYIYISLYSTSSSYRLHLSHIWGRSPYNGILYDINLWTSNNRGSEYTCISSADLKPLLYLIPMYHSANIQGVNKFTGYQQYWNPRSCFQCNILIFIKGLVLALSVAEVQKYTLFAGNWVWIRSDRNCCKSRSFIINILDNMVHGKFVQS